MHADYVPGVVVALHPLTNRAGLRIPFRDERRTTGRAGILGRLFSFIVADAAVRKFLGACRRFLSVFQRRKFLP